MREDEYPLLADFLYQAIYVPEGSVAPPRSIINDDNLQVYIKDFGQGKADKCLLAAVANIVVGAVWVRLMNDYGHIDETTPPLAIAVVKEYRGLRIGSDLMKAMLSYLKEQGYSKVSLSVQKANYASELYQKFGFIIVAENEDDYVMVNYLPR